MKKSWLALIVGIVLVILALLFYTDLFKSNYYQAFDEKYFSDVIRQIENNSVCNVELIKTTEKEKVVISGDIKNIDHIKFDFQNNVLVISNDWAYFFAGKVDIKIYYNQLDKLVVGGSGNITSKGAIENDKLDIVLLGSGEINLLINSENLDVNNSGSGEVKLSGNVNQQQIELIGSGNYLADGLESNFCKIQSAGSGMTQVNVKKTLAVNLAGSGDIVYSGDAQVIESVSGSGKIIKR